MFSQYLYDVFNEHKEKIAWFGNQNNIHQGIMVVKKNYLSWKTFISLVKSSRKYHEIFWKEILSCVGGMSDIQSRVCFHFCMSNLVPAVIQNQIKFVCK